MNIQVYKYMKIEHAIDALKNGIYAGNARDFNDPYEEKGIRYIDQYRICCLASSYVQTLMWAHYGEHQQCCIEFTVEKNIVKYVDYTKNYYKKKKGIKSSSTEIFYLKAYEWRYENEQRAVCDIRDYDENIWKKVEDQYYLRAVAKKIYFGLRVNFENEEVQGLLKYVKEHNLSNKQQEIEVKLCALRDDKYMFTTDEQFDFMREIID